MSYLECEHNEGHCDGSMCDDCEHGPLLPCPNPKCPGGRSLEFVHGICSVFCPDCDMEGPAGDDKKEGRELWNGLPRNKQP